jgi:ABC-type nitrate/sulfonate/bicarbonate transport system substrate-binding protein
MQFLTNFSEKFIQGRPDDARKALQAISDATDWLKDSKNAAEAAQILSKAFRVPEADAPQQLAQLRYTLDWPDVVRDDLVRAGEWLKAKNVIQTAAVSGLVSELLAPELLQQTKSDSVKK